MPAINRSNAVTLSSKTTVLLNQKQLTPLFSTIAFFYPNPNNTIEITHRCKTIVFQRQLHMIGILS